MPTAGKMVRDKDGKMVRSLVKRRERGRATGTQQQQRELRDAAESPASADYAVAGPAVPRVGGRFVSSAEGGWLDETYKHAARVPGVGQYKPVGPLGGPGGANFGAEPKTHKRATTFLRFSHELELGLRFQSARTRL